MNITKEKLVGFLTVFTAIVATIIALASLSTLDRRIALASVALIVFLAIIIAIFYFRERENKAFEDFINAKEPLLPTELEVRDVRNEAELHKIAELDEKTYGKHSVDFQGLVDWWMCYRQGIYALFLHRELVGAVGIWPITEKTFDRLVAGRLKESDIRQDDICEKSEKQIYWYFADIILEKKYRGQKYRGQKISFFLLKYAARAWIKEGSLADTVDLCAIAVTRKGKEFLGGLGFMFVGRKTPDGGLIYRRTAPVTELSEDFEKLWKKGDELQSATPTQHLP